MPLGTATTGHQPGQMATHRQLAGSRFAEDVFERGHAAVWGSHYCIASGSWGYACCLLCERHAECGRSKPALAAPSCEIDDNTGVTEQQFPGESRPLRGSPHCRTNVAEVTAVGKDGLNSRVAAEVGRILAAIPSRPRDVLGLPPDADGYAVRGAFRRIALLLHPDKNPGCEERCRQALLRAQQARDAASQANGVAGIPAADATGAGECIYATRPRQAADDTECRAGHYEGEPQPREDFESAGQFVAYALQYLLSQWQRFVSFPIPGGCGAEAASGKQREAHQRAAASKVARDSGTEGVLHSEAALQQTKQSVKALRKLLNRGELDCEVVEKVQEICVCGLTREYASANQAYMAIAIGNKAWHLDVPTLLEGGIAGMSGVERGRMFKQARTAQRLNASTKISVMDDEAVRTHMVALRRLLAVAQAIRPNSDPSKNAG